MIKYAKKTIAVLAVIAALILMLSITAHSVQSAGTLVLLGLFYIFVPGWIFVNTFLKEELLIEKIIISTALGMILLTLASAYVSLFGFKLSAIMTAALIIAIVLISAYQALQKHKKDSRKHS